MKLFSVILAALALAVAVCAPVAASADESLGGYWQAVRSEKPASGHARPRNRHSIRAATGEGRDLLSVASHYVGSGKITGLPGAWCRDFINFVADKAGIPLANHSRLAIDALRLGPHVSTPRPGDLVVMRHHVTIYAGSDGNRVVGVGGNQGRRVRASAYPRGRVIAFVRL